MQSLSQITKLIFVVCSAWFRLVFTEVVDRRVNDAVFQGTGLICAYSYSCVECSGHKDLLTYTLAAL